MPGVPMMSSESQTSWAALRASHSAMKRSREHDVVDCATPLRASDDAVEIVVDFEDGLEESRFDRESRESLTKASLAKAENARGEERPPSCKEFLMPWLFKARRRRPRDATAVAAQAAEHERFERVVIEQLSDAERGLAISRLCIRQCLCADVDAFLLDATDATCLDDVERIDHRAPALVAGVAVLKRCPLVPRAFGRGGVVNDAAVADAATAPRARRRRELREACAAFVSHERLRDVATGWRVRTRLVATLASPLIYAVALHAAGSTSGAANLVAADGYDAEDWGECYHATQSCVAQILHRRGAAPSETDGAAALVQAVAEGAASSSVMSLSVHAMCAASRRLLQRNAARFMRTAANRRLLSVAYHVAPTSALRQACLRAVTVDVDRLTLWLATILEKRALLGGQSIAQYWAREALGVDRAERALAAARSRLAARERSILAAEVEGADGRAAVAAQRRLFRRADKLRAAEERARDAAAKGARAPSGAAASAAAAGETAAGASPGASAGASPRGEQHDREPLEHDAASDLFARARYHDADSKALAYALRSEAELRRKQQLVDVAASSEFARLVKALIPALLEEPAASLLGDGDAAAEFVDAVVAAWRALARGDGFDEADAAAVATAGGTVEAFLPLHERVFAALARAVSSPERTFSERAAAYEQPARRVVDAALGLAKSACRRDATLWTEIVQWLSCDMLALWHAGAAEALDANEALASLGAKSGRAAVDRALAEADAVLRATKLHKHRKEVRDAARAKSTKKLPPPIPIAAPTIDVLQDLAMRHFKPRLDAFMRGYAAALGAEAAPAPA